MEFPHAVRQFLDIVHLLNSLFKLTGSVADKNSFFLEGKGKSEGEFRQCLSKLWHFFSEFGNTAHFESGRNRVSQRGDGIHHPGQLNHPFRSEFSGHFRQPVHVFLGRGIGGAVGAKRESRNNLPDGCTQLHTDFAGGFECVNNVVFAAKEIMQGAGCSENT